MDDRPIVPDYAGACIANILPALVQHREIGRGWLPDVALDAPRVVLFVIDGLGYDQLLDRAHLAPTLMGALVGAIDSVAPTTTATALTSITTGTAPGEHGVVGYKIRVAGEVLNMLRWASELGDARTRIDPAELQPVPPFAGLAPPVVSQGQFADSGFSAAHLRGASYRPYWLTSSVPVEVAAAVAEGHRFVYAYYDGIDKVAHITGMGSHYDAELAFVDRLVADTLRTLPEGTVVVVTADHGQVQVGEAIVALDPSVLEIATDLSGEARFVWLHGPGRGDALLDAAGCHRGDAWVVPVEQVLDEGWFGRSVSAPARGRLGEVALVARKPIALVDPAKPGPLLQTRHGSMTSAEVRVPLCVAVA